RYPSAECGGRATPGRPGFRGPVVRRAGLPGEPPGAAGADRFMTTSLADFREQVRTFIRDNAPRTDMRDGLRMPSCPEEEDALRAWYRALFDAGLLGGAWPRSWGGDPG